MEALDLARLQFAATTVYHFFFVPLTLGLSILVAIMQTFYWRTDNPLYRRMAKFWGKLFIINFAMGVVTGIVQEFQFGMNWSEYSRFMGDIFGAPLAIEALVAFFLESTFLGVWIFGWDRLPRGVHTFSIWMVALGANISALWILIANSFMQQPVGYVLRNGRAEMENFWELITNPHVAVQFPHVVFSGVTTAGFFVLGISAWHLLRKSENRAFFQRSARIATVYAAIGIAAAGLVGHSQAQHMVEVQPMKMAAAEGLFESEDPAGLSLLTIGDWEQRNEVFSIRIPGALSFLSYNRFDGEVRGIHDLQAEYEEAYGPGEYIPPVAFTYWNFRAMVGAGLLMGALALYALYLQMRRREVQPRWFLIALVAAIALPYIANTSGWFLTEVGRQPWIVFGLQRVEEAVSPNVTAGMIVLSLLVFAGIYGALMVADVFLLAKFGRMGPTDEAPKEGPVEGASKDEPVEDSQTTEQVVAEA